MVEKFEIESANEAAIEAGVSPLFIDFNSSLPISTFVFGVSRLSIFSSLPLPNLCGEEGSLDSGDPSVNSIKEVTQSSRSSSVSAQKKCLGIEECNFYLIEIP